MKNFFIKLARILAIFLANSYYATQFARLIVKVYDNDCNGDMYSNGENKVLQSISLLSTTDSVFIDVGANVGDWSAALARSGVKGRIVAVDPLSSNLTLVREKLSNLHVSNFDLCECALSDTVGKVKFFTNKDRSFSGHDSMFDMQSIGYAESAECIEVECETLDNLTKRLNIPEVLFLKIDVEGNELSVLKGAKSLLAHESIEFIQIEFGHASRAARVYLHDIVDFVNQYKYEIFVIKPKGLLPLDFTPFTENRYSYINFLIVSKRALGKLRGKVLKE